MEVKLSFDGQKWLLKSYWKVENVVEVQLRWGVEFGTPPRIKVTITEIRDKFEVDGTYKLCRNVRAEERKVPLAII